MVSKRHFVHVCKESSKKIGIENTKATRAPMAIGEKLPKDNKGVPTSETTYISMINSFFARVCARYQASPKESHVKVVKRIIRYVPSTTGLGIWFSKDSSMNLVGNVDDRKSTLGGCFYLGLNLVSWCSKKQASILLSTIEVEYIVVGSCYAQLLDEAKDEGHHFIREVIENAVVELKFVSLQDQLGGLFTKPLDTARFEHLRSSIVSFCYLFLSPNPRGKGSQSEEEEAGDTSAQDVIVEIDGLLASPLVLEQQPMLEGKIDTLIDAARGDENVLSATILEEISNEIMVTEVTKPMATSFVP
ncbi:Retrovirus-related Pol polyprotein from transposon TNT 1-94 [Gossypium australe]|uniref:Retrovirus-related Pol polyprotein from transposon TNT 1-94 n=1 Tax=Gossypium australe TaxID=47621 RepID=A0A5B6UUU9_9ROSI|nr:Retrovirus-related Pol polyprotein from transposon TNT 1-94 [Gossypium australe]